MGSVPIQEYVFFFSNKSYYTALTSLELTM